jgi:hypothetical protein
MYSNQRFYSIVSATAFHRFTAIKLQLWQARADTEAKNCRQAMVDAGATT